MEVLTVLILFLFLFLLAVLFLFFRRFLRFFLVGFLLRWQLFFVVDRVVAAEFVDEPFYNLHLSLAAFAHHLAVEPQSAQGLWAVIFAETFVELGDVIEGVAVDAQALVESADAQILLGELVIGQRAEKFEKIAAGLAEAAQMLDGVQIVEIGGADGVEDEPVAMRELFAHEDLQRCCLFGGHKDGDGLVQRFVVILLAVLAAEVIAKCHEGVILFDDHGIGEHCELELTGVVDGFENGAQGAQFFEVVVEGEVKALGLAERLVAAVGLDEFKQGVLAAQRNTQGAQCVAVVGVIEESIAGFDDLLVLALDEGGDADTDRHAEKVEGFHLVEVDAGDADGAFRRVWRQIEHFAAAFFEMHVETGHGAHPIAEIGLVADDDEGVAMFVAADGVGEGVEIAIL